MKDLITVHDFETLIFEFRGKKVMVDTDLAALYETETKKLKQQVRRNRARFPEDFMLELTKEEKDQLLTTAPRLSKLKFSPVNPMVFTEQGVAMLSSVLTSQKAIEINIGIMLFGRPLHYASATASSAAAIVVLACRFVRTAVVATLCCSRSERYAS